MSPEASGNEKLKEGPAIDDTLRDRAEIMNGIIDQLQATFDGYNVVVDAINETRDSDETVEALGEEEFALELEAWLTDEKLDYMAEQMRDDPELEFTLSAVPVAEFENSWDLIKTARRLESGTDQRTVVFDNRAYKGYDPEELIGSGRNANEGPISFTLTPNKVEVIESSGYHRRMRKLESGHSFLRTRNVMDTIGYWFRLDAEGASLLKLPSGEEREDTKSYGGPRRSTSWEGAFINPRTGRGKGMCTHPRLFVTESDELGELVYVDYEHAGIGQHKFGPVVIG